MEMEIFESEIKRLKINSIVERNNFSLVRNIEEGKIYFDDPGRSSIGLDNKFIEKNINEIAEVINNNNFNTSKEVLTQLREAFNTLKINYADLRDYLDRIIEEDEEKLYYETAEKTYYGIVELRASLGLSLEAFDEDSIIDYAEAIKFDVVNKKYKRLDINSHITKGYLRNEKAC